MSLDSAHTKSYFYLRQSKSAPQKMIMDQRAARSQKLFYFQILLLEEDPKTQLVGFKWSACEHNASGL